MKKNIKTTLYRLLAVLLAFSTLGANMTTLSYASEKAGAVEETYCGHTAHTHVEGVCYQTVMSLVCGVEEGALHIHGADCFEAQQVLVCERTEEEPHSHDDSCWGEVEEYTCGLTATEPHTHGDDCYTDNRTLTCGKEVCEAHAHEESCYELRDKLICGDVEWEAHTHSDTCYTQRDKLTCAEGEWEAHAHDDACYTQRDKLTCVEGEWEAHAHDDTCYTQRDKLTCGESEWEAHSHGDSCYTTENKRTCGQSEQAAHSHGDGCYSESETLSCSSTEEGHIHDGGCYTTSRSLSCGTAETSGHSHSESCYSDVTTCTCTKRVGDGHSHSEGCYTPETVQTCTKRVGDGHSHSEGCYTPETVQTCTKRVGDGHSHGEGCYTPETLLLCIKRAGDGHAHSAACYVQEQVIVCGKQEIAEGHAHTDECYVVSHDLTCGQEETEGHAHAEDCTKVELALICGKEETEGYTHSEECYEMQSLQTCKVEAGVPHVHGDGCYTTEITMSCQLAEHVHTDACYVAPVPEKVLICTDPNHEHTEECYALPEELPLERSITDENNLVTVTGLLPENATVQARPLTEEEIAALPVPVEQLLFAYDITIWVDGAEYQPETPVQVTVLPQTQPEQAVQEVLVQHIELDEETNELTAVTEVESTAEETGEVTFSAESFSIYIGTVVRADAGIILMPGTGYNFYKDNNLLSDRVALTEDITLEVRPELGYKITNVEIQPVDAAGNVVDGAAIVGAASDTDGDGIWSVAFTKPASDVGILNQKIVVTVEKETFTTVYLDLAAGNITIGDGVYTGYYYKNDGTKLVKVTASNISYTKGKTRFHIYQSSSTDAADNTAGYLGTDGKFKLPQYNTVTVNVDGEDKTWAEYITNNTNAKQIYDYWHGVQGDDKSVDKSMVKFTDREPTGNSVTISIPNNTECDVVLENIWSTKQPSGSSGSSAGVTFNATTLEKTKVTLRLIGDSKMGRLYYSSKDNQNALVITDQVDGTATGGSLTIVGDPYNLVKGPTLAYKVDIGKNTWQSVLGGDDGGSTQEVYGIVINGGTVYAGSAHESENCTAIGGGGNGMGQVTINGGFVTAVAYTTGTAIGGGIGHRSAGGKGNVTINGGEVYAYNYGVRAHALVADTEYGTNDQYVKNAASHVAGTAIGGASSIMSGGADGYVTINGGYVYAESLGGSAIGGGNSVTKNAGNATITISGGTVVAKSTKQDKYTQITEDGETKDYNIAPGAAIGGGTGGIGSGNVYGDGGYAKLDISGGTVITGSIGGGSTTNKDGKYTTNNVKGKIGHAIVNISGGDVSGQVIMAGGASAACKFTMTGGTLHDSDVTDTDYLRLQKNGGAVYMDDTNGEATISGGVIRDCSAEIGGAIYMTAGTLKLSGDGVIQNCTATAVDGVAESGNGGAIYMGGDGSAKINISGGALYGNTAPKNGGAIYMTNGTVTMAAGSGTVAIKDADDNTVATLPSGSLSANTAAAGQGGAIYMGGGTLTMNGGKIDHNVATAANGGAIYMGGGTLTMKGGSIDHNTTPAANGGGIAMGGGALHITGGNLAYNTAPAGNGGGAYVENGNIIMSDGSVDHNEALQGAGMYVSAPDNNMTVGVKVFSGSVSNNIATNKGGAIAVVGKADAVKQNIGIVIGVNEKHYDETDVTQSNQLTFKHNENGVLDDDGQYEHLTCPEIENNDVTSTSGGGGALYINGSAMGGSLTTLNIYCLEAVGNYVAVEGDDPSLPEEQRPPSSRSDFMLVEGGKVVISAGKYTSAENDGNDGYVSGEDDWQYGAVNILGGLHVTGGQVDMYGNMDNPGFGKYPLTVDVNKAGDHFVDHRYVNSDTRTITYVENFEESPGVFTGQYTLYHTKVPVDATGAQVQYLIESSMYKRDGYSLVGWCTDKACSHSTPPYSANDVLYFDYDAANTSGHVACTAAKDGTSVQLDSSGNLTLYGKWKISDYFIDFVANEPDGVRVSGTMSRQTFKYNVAQNLTPNQFVVDGYEFLGWSTVKGGAKVYDDRHEIYNLTDISGKVIPLYGCWEPCLHNDTDKLVYTVVNGAHPQQKILRRECIKCHSKFWDVTLTATNGSYKKATGQTNLAYLGAIPDGFGFTSETMPEIQFSASPQNAGSYTASVTLQNVNVLDQETGLVTTGNVVAVVAFSIGKTGQDAPNPAPVFEAVVDEDADVLTLTITKCPKSDQSGTDAEYRLTYTKDGELKEIKLKNPTAEGPVLRETDNGSTVSYDVKLPEAKTLYAVEARYQETGNYFASDYVQATQRITYNGAVLNVIYEDGITGLQPEMLDTVSNCVVLNMSLWEGYYLPSGYTFTIVTDGTPGRPFYLYQDVTIDGVKEKRHTLNNFKEDTVVTVTVGGAVRAANISARITERELFGLDVPATTTANISQDSAFTAYFQVDSYDADNYENLRLTFAKDLPNGTSIVLADRSDDLEFTKYWYFKVGTNGALTYNGGTGTYDLPLSAFKELSGGNAEFAVRSNMELQFVVDFANAATGVDVSAGWAVGMTADKSNAESSVPPLTNKEVLSVATESSSFSMQQIIGTAQKELSANLGFAYQLGGAAATKWEGRGTALVLTPVVREDGAELPPDARIRLNMEEYYITGIKNDRGVFVIPMGELDEIPRAVTVELISDMLPTNAADYYFTVEWYMANSSVDTAPMNGEVLDALRAATGGLYALNLSKSADKIPSLQIVSAPQLVTGGNLEFALKQENLDGYKLTVSVQMMKTTTGEYGDTGQTLTYDITDERSIVDTVNLATNYGNNRLRFVVTTTSGQMILEMYHYFIVSRTGGSDSTTTTESF